MAEELIKKSRYRSFKKQSFNNSQFQCLYSVSSNSLNSSQSSCSPTRLRYSIPPSTAQAPHEQNLKSCTEVLSIISPHFRHFILFTLIVFFSINSSLRLSSFNRHTQPGSVQNRSGYRRWAPWILFLEIAPVPSRAHCRNKSSDHSRKRLE